MSAGKSYAARPDSIKIVKERGEPDRRLFAVTFDDQSGNRWFYLVAAELGTAGWIAHGVAGGSDGPARANPRPRSRSKPWLNFCGQWGTDRVYAGGQIHAGGTSVDQVRLKLSDETELTDDADADVALFVSLRGAQPNTIMFLDARGSLICAQRAF